MHVLNVFENRDIRYLDEAVKKNPLKIANRHTDSSERSNIVMMSFCFYFQFSTFINIERSNLEMTKKDQSLFEKMDDEIVLDTNLLQSLATDLVTESNKVNKDIIGRTYF